MDLNDPRRRLQVMQQQNPSIRATAAPELKIAAPAPQARLFVGNQQIESTPETQRIQKPTPQAPTPSFASKLVEPFKPFAEGLTQLFTGNETKALEGIDQLNEDASNDIATAHEALKRGRITKEQYGKVLSDSYNTINSSNKEIADIGDRTDKSKFLGSAVQVAAAPFTGQAGFWGNVAEGTAFGLANEFSSNADPTLKGAAVNTATGATTGGLLHGAGKLFSKAVYALRGGAQGEAQRIVNSIVKADTVEGVLKSLSKALPDVDDKVLRETADYLSNESNPETVRAVLSAIEDANVMPVNDALNPNPDWLPDGYEPRGASQLPPEDVAAIEAAGGQVPTNIEELSRTAKNSFENAPVGEKPGGLERATEEIDNGSAKPIRFRKTPEGDFVIEDGRHRLEAARRAGVNDFPFEDVTYQYRQPTNSDFDFRARFKDAANEIIKNSPKLASDGFTNSNSKDSLEIVVAGLAKNSDKATIRNAVDGLVPGIGSAEKNVLVRKLAEADNPETVATLLYDAADEAKAIKAPAAVEPSITPEQAVESVAPNSNATASPAPKTEAAPVEAATKVTDAKTAFPDADPDAQKAIQEVMDSLGDAERGYSLNEKARSAEKASRAAAGKAAYEAAGGGEAGVRAKLSKLKGKYSESGFNPIEATPEAQTKILDTIEKSGLRDFEKLNTQNALRKVWGAADGKPTPSDISYIRDFFGDEMANAVETAVKEGGSSWQEKLAAIAATPKSAMATADLSAPLRQGGVLGTRFPKEWATAAKDSVKYFASDEAFQKGMAEIKARPNFDVYKKMGLSVDAAEGLTGTEEEFMSSLLESEVLKGNLGRVTAASDRGYSGFLTKLRADVADKILTDVQKAGVELDDKALESLGRFINTASGRGDLGSLEKHAGLLSKALFSPRLWKSRLDLLNPVYYAKLDPVARKYALQSSASFAATAATVLGLATAAGATVEWNLTSADFAKIKIGNTRYDILGGLQQNIVLGMRLVSGKKTNSETGEVTELNKGFAKSRGDILLDFAKNKANPLIGYADKVLNDSNDGSFKDINPLTEAGKLVTPLNFMGIADTTKDTGSLGKGIAMNLPGFGGVGVQTYGTTATKDKGAPNAQGVPSFKGKITEDMVLDSKGTPILDDKGKPVKVKFDKDASDVEKQAQLKKAQSTALSNVAKRLMSKEDAGIYKLGQADKNSLDETQLKKYNQLQKYVQNYGKSIDTPKGADSAPAKTFYQKFNSMSKEDQDSWLKEAPDDNAKTITAALNKQRAAGLSEYKPSNAISKAYAEYEKDLNTHPEYTNIDKRNKAKSFQTTVYKLNYSENQRDIYSEGPSDDLKTLIANKDIDKEDLDNAIKMDNELYASGLTGSLKFTKKFRASMGYATPASKDGTGGGDTKKAYLSNLLPSFSTGGSSSAKPEFSSRSRKPTLKSNASTKGASNSKKISINL